MACRLLTCLLSSLLLSAGCSQASWTGELDGVAIPSDFTSAAASVDRAGETLVIGVWSTLPNTCAAVGALLEAVNDDGDEALGKAAEDLVPDDWWLSVLVVSGADEAAIDGVGSEGSTVSAQVRLCHFGEIEVDVDSPSVCAAHDGDAGVRVDWSEDDHLNVDSEADLVRLGSEDADEVGEIEGRASADHCSGFEEALVDFLDDAAVDDDALEQMLAVAHIFGPEASRGP